MGFSYLGDKNWSDITRDERTYCMYLYNVFKDSPSELLKLIKESPTFEELNITKKKVSFSEGPWEIAYEVCFFRDLMYSKEKPIRENFELLIEQNIKDPQKLIKRTFDLCLFGKNEIIVIEAKAAMGIDKEQLQVKKDIIAVLKGLGLYKDTLSIKLVVLASSKYLSKNSPSYKRSDGTVRELVSLLNKIDVNSLIDIDSLLTWEHISEYMRKNKKGTLLEEYMISRADNPNFLPDN